jgi:hypothetical protein
MAGRKTLRISPELLVDFLRNPVPRGITAEGLPDDARIVDAQYDCAFGCIVLLVESKRFAEGGDLDVVFHRDRGVE